MEEKRKLQLNLVVLLILVPSIAALLYQTRYLNPVYRNLITCRETAATLAHDRLIGATATSLLLDYGREGVEFLQAETSDFNEIDVSNAHQIANYLALSNEPLALTISQRLYESDEQLKKLVGAAGLASHGKLASLNDLSSIANAAKKQNTEYSRKLLSLFDMILVYQQTSLKK